jgi:hypothetical protein
LSKTNIGGIIFLTVSAIIIVTTMAWVECRQIDDYRHAVAEEIKQELKEELKRELKEELAKETKEDLEEESEEEIILTPMGAKAKTYMDYRAITDQSSKQWKLLQTMTIGYDGMIRDDDGYIAAALGSAFGPIGSRYIFTLEDGKELPIIKADQKQDRHTCDDNIFGLNNWDIIEFIVDSSKMPIYPNGYVYGGNFDNAPEYAGDVLCWEKVD